jgi:hypothetical protein
MMWRFESSHQSRKTKEDEDVSEPFLRLEYEHGMDADAGRKFLAEKVAANQLNVTWEGDKANVAVAGATGYIEFEDKKAILIVTDVPFAFRPMKGMIEGQIRGLMKQIYG